MRLVLWIVAIISLLAGLAGARTPMAQTPAELSALAGWKGAQPNPEDTFRFVIISDRTGNMAGQFWDQAVEQVNLLGPDFVMSVGDYIEGYSDDPAILNRQWEQFEAIAARLQAPFFYCPGNHDVGHAGELPVYLARHGVAGASWYSFNYRKCHFLVLDASTWDMDAERREQMRQFIIADLAGAKSADHVFIFYHQPRTAGEFWQTIRENLPDPARATVFNGHTHRLSHTVVDGVNTYVLACTGAQASDNPADAELGDLRMFAHVVVRNGQPTVAMVPVNTLMPGQAVNAAFVGTLMDTINSTVLEFEPSELGQYKLAVHQDNLTGVTLEVQPAWQAEGWNLVDQGQRPAAAMGPGGNAVWRYELTPVDGATATRPVLALQYQVVSPSGRTIRRQAVLPMPVKASVGGSIEQAPASFIRSRNDILDGLIGWEGETDLSFSVRSAVTGGKLLVHVDVTDDMINLPKQLGVQHRDSVMFFFDVRPADQQGKLGRGAGALALALPADGEKVTIGSMVKGLDVPAGIEARCIRREGGYVMEISASLADLGLADAAPGRLIRLDVQVNDRDNIQGLAPVTRMFLSGGAGKMESSRGYAIVTLP